MIDYIEFMRGLCQEEFKKQPISKSNEWYDDLHRLCKAVDEFEKKRRYLQKNVKVPL